MVFVVTTSGDPSMSISATPRPEYLQGTKDVVHGRSVSSLSGTSVTLLHPNMTVQPALVGYHRLTSDADRTSEQDPESAVPGRKRK